MSESRLAVAAAAAKCLHLVCSAGLATFADALAADICRSHVAVELLLNEA